MLFADYETFEARTLRAFDLIYRQFDDVRVDKSLRFLVSDDINIEKSIHLYLQQNPEYPIVVALHYDKFLEPNSGLFLNAIRKNYQIRDLFGYQSPLRHEYYFFGRGKLVENVLDLHKSGQNSGLFGLRKSGKTSTIYAIQRRAKTAGCRTVVIDCQDPAVHARRFYSLLDFIVSHTRQELGLKKLSNGLGSAPDEVSDNFRRQMGQTLNDAQCGVLIIFDEIENISPRTAASEHWREGRDTLLLWQTLRSFFQSAKRFSLTFCFVGTNPHLFETPKIVGVDNPVYLFVPKTFIPMLDLSETSEMVSRLGFFMGLDFEPRVISHIHERFGGHPFFTRQLCSQIHKNAPLHRPHKVSLAACRAAEQAANSDIKSYLTEILSSLRIFYPDEYAMLEYLAGGEMVEFAALAALSESFVEHLVGYGIVVRRADDFEFSFELVREAMTAGLHRNETLTLEKMRLEISRRRNVVEEEIRSFLFRSTIGLDPERWEEMVKSCITAARRSDLGLINRREAFSRNGSRLYFIETLKFVRASEDLKHTSVSIEDISAAMNHINKLRVDAHAGAISEADYNSALQSLDLLEGVFVPP